jgi:cold shock protein
LKYFHFAASDHFRHETKGVAPLAQYKGTVKWFNNAKGYGFLGREGGADVFVHYSSIQREGYKSLKEGDEVEFDIIQGTKGPQADQVSRLKEVSHQANP